MKAAVVPQAGRAPVYGDLNEQAPAAGESRVVVTAAALSPVVKARASGTHYGALGGFPSGDAYIWPASCSRLARNAGDFWRLIAFGFGTGADCQIIYGSGINQREAVD